MTVRDPIPEGALLSAHSPLPWTTAGAAIYAGDGIHKVAEVYGLGHRETIANAAFIVHAVNTHDELVAALRAILFQVSQGKILERDSCVSQARAAMANTLAGKGGM